MGIRGSSRSRVTVIAVLLLTFVAALGPAAGEEGEADLEVLLGELDGLSSVAGGSVGFSGVESPFYKLFRRLLEVKAEGLPERLLASPRPVRRSMGLVLLVSRDGTKATGVLREKMDDRGPVVVNPFGCVSDYGSVGVVARQLLGNRNWIADYPRREPLLRNEELLAIDVELLARDDTVLHHEHVGEDVLDAIKKGRLSLDLAALEKKYPSLSAVSLVKALGRLRSDAYFSDAQKPLDRWILSLAADREQAVPVRLAAASSLAHWLPWEDYEAPRPFPAKSLEGLPDESLGVIRRDFESVRQIRREDDDAPTLAAGHVLLAPELRHALSDLAEHESEPGGGLPGRLLPALMRLSGRLGEWQPEWNTFGDGIYVLDAAVEEYGDRLREELGPERFALLVKRLRAAIAEDD